MQYLTKVNVSSKCWVVPESIGSFFFFFIFFSIRASFNGHWRLTGQQRKGRDKFLLHSITSTRSRTFKYLFPFLLVRWLSHIFNRIGCIYQTAIRWDLPPYRITIWLIDDIMLIFVCLLGDLVLGFCYSNLTRETGGLEIASTTNQLTKCASHPMCSELMHITLTRHHPYHFPWRPELQRKN